MSSSVDQIKSKIDIVSLISSYIKLDKAGTNFKGRCPFHNEKTPSFFVSPDRGSYYCFGCQAKGDIFTFVQEFEGLDFIGSLKVLADRAGVTLESYNSEDKTEKQRLHSVLEQAVFFYEKNLANNKTALDYLHNRGVLDSTIKDFRIGFAPAEWRSLFEYLLGRGVSEKDMLLVGLIKRKEGTTDSYYDTFRGRIMFPINDSSGRVVGFSGRILVADDKSPKYLNSPETSLFNKSEILFGLDKAKNNIRLKDYSILVEGQMDLIMLHQVGINNTVASSGTALTEKHVINLQRRSNRIIMFFDADGAGFSASNKATQIAFLSLDMEVKLAQMPQGKDPADLARENPEELRNILRSSKHIIDFYVDTLMEKKLPTRDLGKEIQNNVFPYILAVPGDIQKSNFIKRISFQTGIKEEALWEDLKHVGVGQFVSPKMDTRSNSGIKRTEAIERRVFGIIIWQKESPNRDENINIEEIEKRANRIFGERKSVLEEQFLKEKDLLLFEIESYYGGKPDLRKDIEYLLLGLEEEYLKQRLSVAMVSLQKAEQSKNGDEILKYLTECQEISKQINTIKNNYEK